MVLNWDGKGKKKALKRVTLNGIRKSIVNHNFFIIVKGYGYRVMDI